MHHPFLPQTTTNESFSRWLAINQPVRKMWSACWKKEKENKEKREEEEEREREEKREGRLRYVGVGEKEGVLKS